jgi:hypothetical protein
MGGHDEAYKRTETIGPNQGLRKRGRSFAMPCATTSATANRSHYTVRSAIILTEYG